MSAGFDVNNLYGIDISSNAIANCKKNGIENSFVMDAQTITLTEKFDIIIASDNLEHLEKEMQAIINWKDLLKPGGHVCVRSGIYVAMELSRRGKYALQTLH